MLRIVMATNNAVKTMVEHLKYRPTLRYHTDNVNCSSETWTLIMNRAHELYKDMERLRIQMPQAPKKLRSNLDRKAATTKQRLISHAIKHLDMVVTCLLHRLVARHRAAHSNSTQADLGHLHQLQNLILHLQTLQRYRALAGNKPNEKYEKFRKAVNPWIYQSKSYSSKRKSTGEYSPENVNSYVRHFNGVKKQNEYQRSIKPLFNLVR